MTDKEAIAAVRLGERVRGPYSLHLAERPDSNQCRHTLWRTLFCDGETDVVECRDCGRQMVTKCDFDEEFA